MHRSVFCENPEVIQVLKDNSHLVLRIVCACSLKTVYLDDRKLGWFHLFSHFPQKTAACSLKAKLLVSTYLQQTGAIRHSGAPSFLPTVTYVRRPSYTSSAK